MVQAIHKDFETGKTEPMIVLSTWISRERSLVARDRAFGTISNSIRKKDVLKDTL